MKRYVLDASVAAKWVLPGEDEPFSDRAAELLQRYAEGQVDLAVPDLFWPEMGNILWRAARLGRITPKTAHEAILWLPKLNLQTSLSRIMMEDAVLFAMREGRAVYDSVYVVMATYQNREVVTADEKLVNAVGTRFPVRWLAHVSV